MDPAAPADMIGIGLIDGETPAGQDGRWRKGYDDARADFLPAVDAGLSVGAGGSG